MRPLLRTVSGCGGPPLPRGAPQGLKRAEEPEKRGAEQYSAAWLLLRDHPSTCPLPLLRPRSNPHPKTPWSSFGNRTATLLPSPFGDRFHVRAFQLSTPDSALPLQLSLFPEPRTRKRCSEESEVLGGRGGTPDEGRELGSPKSALPRKGLGRGRLDPGSWVWGASPDGGGQVCPSQTHHHPTPYALSWARASEVPLRSGGILHPAHSPPGAQSAGSY